MNKPLEKIFRTRSKITYYIMNSNEKNNYILIKDLIKIFSNDIAFLKSILRHKPKNISDLELADIYYDLIILISKKYSNDLKMQKLKNKYFKKLDSLIYNVYKIDFNSYNPNNEDEIYFKEILLKEEFKENIARYIAKRMVNEIYNLFDLEYQIHEDFVSFEELEKYGIDEFIFNILDRYDDTLSLYAFHNKIVIEDIYTRLSMIKYNWDNYYLIDRESKYKNLMNELNNYSLTNHINNKLFLRLAYYTAYKSNYLEEFFFHCKDSYIEPNFENLEEIYNDCKEIDKNNDFFFLKHYLKLKDIFEKELKETITDEFIFHKIKKR